ncbi:MAG: hypothetical protein ACREJB_04255 [Planctomycetaceae bacterium]
MRTLTLRQRVPVAAGLLLVLSGTMAGCAQRSPGMLARIWGPDSLAERAAEKWEDAWDDSRLASLSPLRPDPKQRDWTKDPFLDDAAPREPEVTADATNAAPEGGFASDIDSQMAYLRAEMQRPEEPAGDDWPAWAAHDPQPELKRSLPVEPEVPAEAVVFRHASEFADADEPEFARESSPREEEPMWSAASQIPWPADHARAEPRWQPVEAEGVVPLIEENWQPAPSERAPTPSATEDDKIADATEPRNSLVPVMPQRPARRTVVTPVSARRTIEARTTTDTLPVIRPNYALSMGRSGAVPIGWRTGSVRVTPAIDSQVRAASDDLPLVPPAEEVEIEELEREPSNTGIADRVPELILFDRTDSSQPGPETAAPESAPPGSATANSVATRPLSPRTVEPAATPPDSSSAAADRPLLLIPSREPAAPVASPDETKPAVPVESAEPAQTPRRIPDVNLDGETAQSAEQTRIPVTLWVALGAGVLLVIGLWLRRKGLLAVPPER